MATYRSPYQNLDEALVIISSLLNDKKLEQNSLLIMGKINDDNLKMDRKSAKGKETLASHNRKNCATTYRINPDPIKSIDWICTNGNTDNL